MKGKQAQVGQVWINPQRNGIAVVHHVDRDGVPSAKVQEGFNLRVGAQISAEWVADGYELPRGWQEDR